MSSITKEKICLMASERILEQDDALGGGRISGNQIYTGTENSMFLDISGISRVNGRCDLAKTFVSINTNNTDSYLGAHVIVSEIPEDDTVSVTLFSTKNWVDTRSSAKDYIEKYLDKGSRLNTHLLSNQPSGTKVLTLWQRTFAELPDIGSVIVLVYNEGLSTEYEQYVRVTTVSSVERTYVEVQGSSNVSFNVNIVTVGISEALLYDFPGIEPRGYDTGLNEKVIIRSTIPVDAAHYYGTSQLKYAVDYNDPATSRTVIAKSLYSQLVPSSRAALPATNLNAGSQNIALIQTGTATVTLSINTLVSATQGLYTGSAIVPGTLTIGLNYTPTFSDKGGLLIVTATQAVVGLVDYNSGAITFNGTYNAITGISFKPAAPFQRVGYTSSIKIVPENRTGVYVGNLFPYPTPGSVFVDYRSQNKWYRLYDDSNGALRGSDTSFGVGSVNYVSGDVTLTTGALPDNDSEVIFYWNTATTTYDRSSITIPPVGIKINLTGNAGKAIFPGSYSCQWTTSGNVTYHLDIDDGHGNLSGTGGTGKIKYSTAEVTIYPSHPVSNAQQFKSSYNYGDPITETFTNLVPDGVDHKLHITLAHTDILPGTFEISWVGDRKFYNPCDYVQKSGVIGEGEGFIAVQDYPVYGYDRDVHGVINTASVIADTRGNSIEAATNDYGTIDYVNGTVLVPSGQHTVVSRIHIIWQSSMAGGYYGGMTQNWYYMGCPVSFREGLNTVTVKYRVTDDTSVVTDEIFTMAEGTLIDLTPTFKEYIIPGSVRFTYSGYNYFDRDGYLYHYNNDTPTNGAGTLSGTIDYSTGQAKLTDWNVSGSNTFTLTGLLTHINIQPIDSITFRTPGYPLVPGSLTIRYTRVDQERNSGYTISTADSDGLIEDDYCIGTVDYESGVVKLRFGQWVDIPADPKPDWYSIHALDNLNPHEKVFKPLHVYSESIKFNCVIYTYTPVSSDILGLNPTRLPFDGKVLTFKQGDFIVIHNTNSVTCANPVVAGSTTNAGRVRLSRIECRDANDVIVDPALYSENLDAGTITWDSPLDLSDYTQPISLYHTIEDLAMASDVQVNGTITLNQSVTHSYPVTNNPKTTSYLSSAMVLNNSGVNDLYARVSNIFGQQTWVQSNGSYWSDSRIGNEIIAKYNQTAHPIIVENASCINERWALIFTSTTTFNIVGETLGQIGTGSINVDCEPINENTGRPLWKIFAVGFGTGYANGNVLRFNTYAANYPLWCARTILQSQQSSLVDNFRLLIRGDIDA